MKKLPLEIENLIFEYLGGKKVITAHFDVMYNIARKWDNCFDISHTWHTPYFLVHLMRQIKYIKRINENLKFLTFKMLVSNYNYLLKDTDDITEQLGYNEYLSFETNIYELMKFMSQFIEGERKKSRAIAYWGLEPSNDGITNIMVINYKLLDKKINIKLYLCEEIFNQSTIPNQYIQPLYGYCENGLIDSIELFKI